MRSGQLWFLTLGGILILVPVAIWMKLGKSSIGCRRKEFRGGTGNSCAHMARIPAATAASLEIALLTKSPVSFTSRKVFHVVLHAGQHEPWW